MFRKHYRALLRATAAVTAVAGVAVFAAPAGAANTAGQLVTGTVTGTLTLTAGTPSAFTSFTQGGSYASNTAVGALTAVDTSPTWALSVQDNGNDGHLQATGGACSGSATELGNPLKVTVTNPLGAVHSDGLVTVPGKSPASAVEVANDGTGTLLNTASAFVTTYGQQIDNTESLLTGCVYTLTATYTLQ
jgi:hypothetical protein